MLKSSKRIIVLVVLVSLITGISSAFACYSGLTIIPTADVVGDGGYGFELQFDGTLPVKRADTKILNTEFGLGTRSEAGVDFDFSDDSSIDTLFNAKYLLITENETTPALALGVCNVGKGTDSIPYLVATKDFHALRLHLGAIRLDKKNRAFIGLDKQLGEKLTAMADYTQGRDNYSSVGIGYQFNDHIGLMTGVQFPNNHDDEKLYTVHLVFTGKSRAEEKE